MLAPTSSSYVSEKNMSLSRRLSVLSRHADAWVLLGSMVASGLAAVAFGTDLNWDLVNYHLYNPYAYLHGRYAFDVGPAQVQSYLNPVADLPFYGMVQVFNGWPRVIAFTLGACHGINFLLLFRIVQLIIDFGGWPQKAVLQAAALAIGVTGAGVIGVLGTTTNDLVPTIFVLAGLLPCIRISAGTGDARTVRTGFLIAGASLGIAVGLKFTMASFVPAFSLIVIYLAIVRTRYVDGLRFACAFLIGLLLVAGHHMWTLWQIFGNPVFPFFNGYFRSPFYELVNFRDIRHLPSSIVDTLAYPFYWAWQTSLAASDNAFRDIRLALTEILLVTLLVIRAGQLVLRRPPCARVASVGDQRFGVLAAFVVVSYLVWVEYFAIYRYVIVLEMLSGAVTVAVLIRLIPGGWARTGVVLAAMAAAIVSTRYFDMAHGKFGTEYIEVVVPPLSAGSQLLTIGGSPLAYIVPYLDPSVRVLGIENNYLNLGQSNRLVEKVRQAVREPVPARFLAISPDVDPALIQSTLNALGLSIVRSSCLEVRTNLYMRQQICPVERAS